MQSYEMMRDHEYVEWEEERSSGSQVLVNKQ